MSHEGLQEIRPLVISKAELIRRAESLALDVFPQASAEPFMWSFSFNQVYEEIIYPDYGISVNEDEDLGSDESGEKILGEFDPINKIAYIDRSLEGDPRKVFTLWHEVVGHGVLQGDWIRSEIDRLGSDMTIVTTESSLSDRTKSTLEWQANQFAGYAAAPTALLERAVIEQLCLEKQFRFIGPGSYQLSTASGKYKTVHCDSFLDLCHHIAKRVRYQFGYLSAEALSYRIAELRFIVDTTRSRIFTLRRVANSSNRRANVLAS